MGSLPVARFNNANLCKDGPSIGQGGVMRGRVVPVAHKVRCVT